MAISLTADDAAALRARHPSVFAAGGRGRSRGLYAALGVAGYLVFCWWFFAIGTVLGEARWERAGAYLADWVSYDVRPTLRFRDGAIDVTYPRFNVLGDNPRPVWIRQTAPDRVEMDVAGALLTATPAEVVVTLDGARAVVDLGTGRPVLRPDAPAFAVQRESDVRFDLGFSGSIEVKANRIAVVQRFFGWANFVFDTRSPFYGMGAGEVLAAIVAGERIDPDRSNLALAAVNFWNNADWQHGDVFAKLLQTIVMAFAGTLLAAIVAFPLAFLAARNITRSRLANQLTRRYFDFKRTVDGLIWALFFIRAFGPGPIPGIAAIFFTDIGSLGKLYAEALENVDDRQREGVRSVGAPTAAVHRYGVLPQVLPVFISQALYHLESNTRSATIIGAVGAGGIGLKLLEAIRTNQDWENVCYMVLLILLVVYAIDALSGAVRRRLIGEAQA